MSQMLRKIGESRPLRRAPPIDPFRRRPLPRFPTWRPAVKPAVRPFPLFPGTPPKVPGTFGRLPLPEIPRLPSVPRLPMPYWRWMFPRLLPWLGWAWLAWDLWNYWQQLKPQGAEAPDDGMYHFCYTQSPIPQVWYWYPFDHCFTSYSAGASSWSTDNKYLHHRELPIPGNPLNWAVEYWGPFEENPGYPDVGLPDVVTPPWELVPPAPVYPPMPVPDPRQGLGPFRGWDPDIFPPGLPDPGFPLPVPWPAVPGRNPYHHVGTRFRNQPGVSIGPDGLHQTPGHVVRPQTDRNQKERKIRDNTTNGFWLRAFKAAQRNFHRITEYGDAVEAVYEALPKELQTCKPKTPQCMSSAVFKHYEKVDMPQAIINLAVNHVEDKVVGKFFAELDKSAKKLGSNGYKFELPIPGLGF